MTSSSEPYVRPGLLDAERHGRVLLLVLDRPDVLNAFSRDLYRALGQVLAAIDGDDDIAVVVLTGRGRAFSAGVDRRDRAARAVLPFAESRVDFTEFVDALAGMRKPVIAAVNGVAVGVGATVLGLVDLVVMSTDARLRLPFAELEVAPEAGSTATLSDLLGAQQTAWLMLSGSWMSAAECLDAGLAWQLAEPDELVSAALHCATTIAKYPIHMLTRIKSLLVRHREPALALARQREEAEARLLHSRAEISTLRAPPRRPS